MSRNEYPLTLAAAKRAEKSTWAIGDALLEEIGPPGQGKKQSADFSRCAKELAEQGMPYSSGHLVKLRNVAHKFNVDRRSPTLTTEVAREAGTPAVLAKAEKMAEDEGVPVTKRYVAKVAKASRKQERKAKGKPQAPERDKSRVTAKSETQLSWEIVLSTLETDAKQAAKLGRDFTTAVAGFDLGDDDRDGLLRDIDKVLRTWTAVREAVANPIADEAAQYLKAVN